MAFARPKHIAVIPDGNRRWARKHGKSPVEGHEAGIDNLGNLLKWCREFGVRECTAWGFSTENFDRPPSEVYGLMKLFEKKLREFEKNDDLRKNKIRVCVLGDLGRFPSGLRNKIMELEKSTEKHDKYRFNVLLSYGGRKELLDAVNRALAGGARHVDDASFRKLLWTGALSSDPDLVIRTAGESRTSGFLPWQSAYSEYYFSKKLWPDFGRADFVSALRDYSKRKRRFGK
ncbi:Tritrans,polycis-undecaprenyl-diphosphate synthase (GGDP specific) [Candidatus Burarchaeum australiense]|nr:Tritrans,polycis-undecaprenyl-diphosphate synthase (GGDP specific) [Candidatus Burarchaeum australiense]